MSSSLALLFALAPQIDPCQSGPEAHLLGPGTDGAAGIPALVLGGAPLISFPLSLRVESIAPGAVGALAYSGSEMPLELPVFGATVFPSQPFVTVPFVADAEGGTPALIDLPSIPAALCGATLVSQAFTFDAEALGGVAFTPGYRLGVGPPNSKAPFPTYAVPVDGGATETLAVDVDLDGQVDLVTVSEFGELWVSLGLSNGTFRPADTYLVGSNHSAVGVGLLNDDLLPDLVIAEWLNSQVLVMLGIGEGDFTLAATVPTQNRPDDIALADLNADGLLDVALAHNFDGLSIHYGLPGGLLGPSEPLNDEGFAQGDGFVQGVSAADVNGDGVDDLLASLSGFGNPERILVRLGSASSGLTLVPDSLITTVLDPEELVAGDLNGDGNLDLLIDDVSGPYIARFFGNGDGTFSEILPGWSLSGSPSAMAFADFDSDSVLDLAVTSWATGSLSASKTSTYRGLGDGSFVEIDAVPAGPFTWTVAMAEVDGDGILDVMTLSEGSRSVQVAYGRGDGLLTGPTSIDGTDVSALDMAVADLNGDGRDDLVIATPSGLSVKLTTESGFGDLVPYDVDADIDDLEIAFVDDDDVLDIVSTSGFFDSASVLYGVGDGTFTGPTRVTVTGDAQATVVGDLDGDGHRDLAVACLQSFDVKLFFSDGFGGFVAGPSLASEGPAFDLDVADLDGDGLLDVVFGKYSLGQAVRVYRGLGGGGFAFAADLPAPLGLLPKSPRAIAVEDLDADGHLDIVTVVELAGDGSALIYLGRDDNGFDGPLEFPLANNPNGIEIAEVTGDQRLDLLFYSEMSSQDEVVLLRSSDSGGFLPPLKFVAGSEPQAIAVGRFGDDLIPDVFVALRDGPVRVLENLLLD